MPSNKRLRSCLVYAAYLLAVVVAADYLCYRYYLTRLVPGGLSREKLPQAESLLFVINKDRQSSFLNFPEQKRPGVIRIGCFGDSFTYGDEVRDGYDYPALLARLFRERGFANVEVLNFGMSGYGFHQAYNSWDLLGRRYGLDYLLIGPECFQHDRDSSFNPNIWQSSNHGRAYCLHARFILDGEGFKLVEPIGENLHERVATYFRFLPPYRYLRYDWQAPAFLNAPIACFFPGREFKRNPFYYQKDMGAEMDELYRRLLCRMADGPAPVILATHSPDIINMVRPLKKERFLAARLLRSLRFPYYAIGGHNSPNMNMLLAEQMFDLLGGRQGSSIQVIEISSLPKQKSPVTGIAGRKEKLSRYDEITFEIEGIKIGRFYEQDAPLGIGWSKYCQGRECQPQIETLKGVSSLVAFPVFGAHSLADAVFIPVDYEVTEGMPVVAGVRGLRGVREYRLGELALVDSRVNIGVAGVKVKVTNDGTNAFLELEETAPAEQGPLLYRGDLVSIKVGGKTVLTGKVERQGAWPKFDRHASGGKWVFIRADGREILEVGRLPEQGLLELCLYSGGQETLRIPFASWSKKEITVHYDGRVNRPIPGPKSGKTQ